MLVVYTRGKNNGEDDEEDARSSVKSMMTKQQQQQQQVRWKRVEMVSSMVRWVADNVGFLV